MSEPKSPTEVKPLQLWERAQQKRSEVLREFADLLQGPNPLTRKEVQALYSKRPDVYPFLAKW